MPKDKPGTGVLFKSRSPNPNAPKLSGTIITPDGEKLRISCWVAVEYDEDAGRFTDTPKVTKDGDTYLKVKVEEDDAPRQSRPAQTVGQPVADSDIPF